MSKENKKALVKKDNQQLEKKKELKLMKVYLKDNIVKSVIALNESGYTVIAPEITPSFVENCTFCIIDANTKHALITPSFAEFRDCPFREITLDTFKARFKESIIIEPGAKVLVPKTLPEYKVTYYIVDLYSGKAICGTKRGNTNTVDVIYLTLTGGYTSIKEFDPSLAGKVVKREDNPCPGDCKDCPCNCHEQEEKEPEGDPDPEEKRDED